MERHRSNYLQQRDALGAHSLYALSSASNYARDLRETGRLREALDLLEETVRTYRQTIGDNHTDTLRARKNLAVALRRAGRYIEALEIDEDIYRRCLDINGPEHPDTLAAATNLASDYNALGDTDRAIPLAERALARYRDYLGENHPVTLAGANNLSVYLRLAGRPAEARELSGWTLAQFRAVLGPRHLYNSHRRERSSPRRWFVPSANRAARIRAPVRIPPSGRRPGVPRSLPRAGARLCEGGSAGSNTCSSKRASARAKAKCATAERVNSWGSGRRGMALTGWADQLGEARCRAEPARALHWSQPGDLPALGRS
ncbi:tetratricopeptide repeat protein [Kitasatospora sp. NPDC101155]|uniref:tetratricopeptide repeat protein n=1 Tax=Kitasatospora sp. NPDC101155 TaxID=3364097 RepID=UPI00381592DF